MSWFFQPLESGTAVQQAGGTWDGTLTYSSASASSMSYVDAANASPTYSTSSASSLTYSPLYNFVTSYLNSGASAASFAISPSSALSYSGTSSSLMTYLLDAGVSLTSVLYNSTTSSSISYAALFGAAKNYNSASASSLTYNQTAPAIKNYNSASSSANTYNSASSALSAYSTSTTSVPARWNELSWSNDLRNTTEAGTTRPWSQYVDGNTNVRLVDLVGPFGSPTVTSRVELTVADANGSTQKGAAAQQSRPDNTNYTVSVYAKADQTPKLRILWVSKTVSTWPTVIFNLTTGAYALQSSNGASPVSASTVDMGNGWWRCIATFSSGVSGNTNCGPSFQMWDNVACYVGAAGDGFYLYGAQIELGNVATVYQSTMSDLTEVMPEYRAVESYASTSSSSHTYSQTSLAIAAYLAETASSILYYLGSGAALTPVLYSSSTTSTVSYVAVFNALKSYNTSTTSSTSHGITAGASPSYSGSTTSNNLYNVGGAASLNYSGTSSSANSYLIQALALKSYVSAGSSAFTYNKAASANTSYSTNTISLVQYQHVAQAIASYLSETYGVQSYEVQAGGALSTSELQVAVQWYEWEMISGNPTRVSRTADLVVKLAQDGVGVVQTSDVITVTMPAPSVLTAVIDTTESATVTASFI